jgi:hypothetical protein
MYSIEVEVDDATGEVHPVDPETKFRKGRAILSWPDSDDLYPALMSEKSLEDWLTPEEDAAWAHFQPVK